jgi:hypothetical protein
MKREQPATDSAQPSDLWIRRLTGLGMGAGFLIMLLTSFWMQVAHSLGLTGLFTEPRLLSAVGLTAMALPFIVFPLWAAFHYRRGAVVFGRPVSRDEAPIRWFGGYSIFVAIGLALLTVAILSWTRVIDFTPKEWIATAPDAVDTRDASGDRR